MIFLNALTKNLIQNQRREKRKTVNKNSLDKAHFSWVHTKRLFELTQNWAQNIFCQNISAYNIENYKNGVLHFYHSSFIRRIKVRCGANRRLYLSVWPASINSLSTVGIGKSAIAASNA